MGDVVIVAYRPKPGCAEALQALARGHVPQLRDWGFVTEREPVLLRGQHGMVVEVFEWREGGIDAAHADPRIHAMWESYAQVCDYVALQDLPEAAQMFATFRPLD